MAYLCMICQQKMWIFYKKWTGFFGLLNELTTFDVVFKFTVYEKTYIIIRIDPDGIGNHRAK